MAKPANRRLKVFQAQFGFYDTVVAAPSQAAALRAWGIHQDLFASGDATVTTDAASATAALEHPGVPLRRAVGSKDPFQLEPANLPKIPGQPKRRTGASPRKAKSAEPVPPPADRAPLEAAEAALREIDEARKREEAALRERQDELDMAKAQAQSAYLKDRKAATDAVTRARRAYRQAGGRE